MDKTGGGFNLGDAEIARRVLFSLVSAFCIVFIAAVLIGPRNKQKWFNLRDMSKGFWFFNRRGILGESLRFGWPRTKEGYLSAAGILAAVALTTFVIFNV